MTLQTGDRGQGAAVGAAETGWVLAGLRVSLHVCFAGLLAFAWVRVVLLPGIHPVEMGLCALLGGWYLVSTVHEKRQSQAGGTVDRREVLIWTVVTVLIWAVLLCLQLDFTWLAFPLFFLVQYPVVRFARTARGLWLGSIGVVGVVLAAVLVRQGPQHGLGGIIGPSIGAVLAVVMFQAYRAMHLQNQALAFTERRAGVLAERDRLAREIHDTLTQGLASIVLMSRAATESLRRDQIETALEQVGIIEQAASTNLAESRRFVRDLRVPDGDLAELLALTVEQFAAQQRAAGQSIRATFATYGRAMPLPDAHAQALLRTTQSSLANVAEHAHADSVQVALTWAPERVELTIRDAGRGFDPEAVASATVGGRGVGLASVQERISELGGGVLVDSAPGEGTIISVWLPVS